MGIQVSRAGSARRRHRLDQDSGAGPGRCRRSGQEGTDAARPAPDARPKPSRARGPVEDRRPSRPGSGSPLSKARSGRSRARNPSGSAMRSCAPRSFRRRCCRGAAAGGRRRVGPAPGRPIPARFADRGAGRPARRRRGGGPALCGHRSERDRRLVDLALLHGLHAGAASSGDPPRQAEHHDGCRCREHREPGARHDPRAAAFRSPARAFRSGGSDRGRPSARCGLPGPDRGLRPRDGCREQAPRGPPVPRPHLRLPDGLLRDRRGGRPHPRRAGPPARRSSRPTPAGSWCRRTGSRRGSAR